MVPGKDMLIWMYEKMLLIRYFEEKVVELFAAGKIPGFVHSYIWEEAVAVGTCANLRKDDFITSTHRGHGHLLAKGGDPRRMMAELFGKKTGYCKGKGGSMHIASIEVGILGANGIVGGGIPMAGGAAYALSKQGKDSVVVCFFGDGASNQGTFHEALNLASIWKLPVIYVCENNFYGISMSQARHQNIKYISQRADSYGIPGVTVDGMDVLAVYDAVGTAVARARAGEGPTLVEARTYRKRGHFEGDPDYYRPKEEIAMWAEKEPIARFKDYLIREGVITSGRADEIASRAQAEVEEAVRFAEESPEPDPEDAVTDVYTDLREEVRAI